MSQIGWNESNPPDTESAGLGDDRIRSLTTSLRQGLDDEHVWPSSSGDAGKHRLGSAKAYVGTQSQVSSTGTDGKLMWATDTLKFFHVGSTGTALIGGNRVISAGSTPGGTLPQRHYWCEEFGAGTTSADGSAIVTIPDSGYSGQPYIFVSGYTTVAGPGRPPVWDIVVGGAATFTVWAWDPTFSLSQGSHPFFWRSLGTRVL